MSRGGSARQRRTVRRKTERLVASGLQVAQDEESTGVEDAQPIEDTDIDVTSFEIAIASPVTEEFDVDAALESLEQFADDNMGSCGECSHPYAQHGDSGCAVENCDCMSYDGSMAVDTPDEPDASDTAAVEEIIATPTFVMTTTAAAAPTAATTVSFSLQNIQFVDEKGNLLVYTPADGTAGNGDTSFQTVEDVVVAPAATASNGLQWVATLCPEGTPTADGRIFAPGSITWRELPLTLMGMIETAEGHDGAQVCGRIDRIWRDEATGEIMGAGIFDTAGEFGSEIARLVGDGTLRGLSVDIAVAAMEILPRDEVIDASGNWIAGDREQTDEEPDPMDVLFGGDDLMFVVLEGIIGAATVCPFPAFAEAKIEVASSLVAAGAPNVWTVTQQAGFRVTGHLEALVASAAVEEEVPAVIEPGEHVLNETQQDLIGLTAGAALLAPLHPPLEWFDDPQLEELTPLTVTDDGQVYGHVAPWGVCHIGLPGVCTTAPATDTNYAYYLTKEVVCEDGSRVTVGTITMDTDHAGRDVGRAAAAAHYDNTGVAAADIVVGEDEFGIWLAGAIRPDLSAEKTRALQGASVSGDWREVNGNLEMVGVLAVNVPGFPIPRLTASLVASGDGMQVTSLIAAGVIGRGDTNKGALTRSEINELELLRDVATGEYAALADIAKEATA